MKRVLVICGTRPEAIKLAPVVLALRRHPEAFHVTLCVTGQHRELLDPVLRFFELRPDVDLNVMRPNQSLATLTASLIAGLAPVLIEARPDVVIVQGDTTTAMAGALAAFYARVPVAHVEAGLRTNDRASPFPEEMNRVLVGRLADLHFAPTDRGVAALAAEGLTTGVHLTGNTVTDALLHARGLIEARTGEFEREFALNPARRLVLITTHRRENFGPPLERIFRSIATLAREQPDVEFIFPMHLNPNMREVAARVLQGVERVRLIEPVDYPRMVFLLSRCELVLTDSGGLQEEAPTLGKPVLVLRDVTERPEGIVAGCAALVGTDEARIVGTALQLLRDPAAYARMAHVANPYGDGHAAERIVGLLTQLPPPRNNTP